MALKAFQRPVYNLYPAACILDTVGYSYRLGIAGYIHYRLHFAFRHAPWYISVIKTKQAEYAVDAFEVIVSLSIQSLGLCKYIPRIK